MLEPRSALLRPGAQPSNAVAVKVAKVLFAPDSGVDRKAWTVPVGGKAYFKGYAYNAAGKAIPEGSVTFIFKSSNPKVFAVDSLTGVGVGLATGFFQLTVKVGSLSAMGGMSVVAATTATAPAPTVDSPTTTTTAPTTTTTSPTTTTTAPTAPTAPTTAPTAPTTTPSMPTAAAPTDSVFLATLPTYLAKVRQGFEDVWTADGAAWAGVGTAMHGGGGDYYDRVSSLDQFAALSIFANVATTYRQRAWAMATDYGVKYLDANRCGASPHWSQLDGLYRQWRATGDTAAARRVRCTADVLALAFDPTSDYLDRRNGEGRILGRVLLSQVMAWRVARDQNDAASMTKYAARRSTYFAKAEAWIQPDGSFPSDRQVCGGQLNYMIGLLSDALIEATTDDPTLTARAVTLLRSAYTYIWTTQRRADGSLNYASVTCSPNANGEDVGGPGPSPDLDLDHVSNLAWLALQTGNAQWRTFADALFADGTARGFWYGGKQYNELVQFGAKYLVLRGVR